MEHFNIDIMELILKKLSYQDAINFMSVFTEAYRSFNILPNIKNIIIDNTLANVEHGWEKVLFNILNKYNISKININKHIIQIFYIEGIIIQLDYTKHSGFKNEFKLNIYYNSSIFPKKNNILSFHIYGLEHSVLKQVYICTSISNDKLISYTTLNPILDNDLLLKTNHVFVDDVNRNIKSNYLDLTRTLIKNINKIWYFDLLDSYYNCLDTLYDILSSISINQENNEFYTEYYNDLEYEKQLYTKIHENVSLLHIDVNLYLLLSILNKNEVDNESVNSRNTIFNKNIDIQIKY